MPEPIQLLDEHGTRTRPPEWDPWIAGPRRRRARRPLRGHGRRPPHRHRGDRAPAPGRARPLAAAARARRPRRSAPAARSAPTTSCSPATARTASPTAAASTSVDLVRVWRGTHRLGVEPVRHQHGHAAGHHRRADAARDRLRARHPERRRRRRSRVAYFGDGATSQGDVNEAMVFAVDLPGARRLLLPEQPVGDLRAGAPAGPRAARRPARPASASRRAGRRQRRARGHGRDARRRSTAPAPEAARRFIEAVTYRMGPHTTSDDPTRYRDPAELEEWGAADPIARLRRLPRAARRVRRRARGAASREAADASRASCARDAPRSTDPPALDVFDHVYAEPHPGSIASATSTPRYLEGFAREAAR